MASSKKKITQDELRRLMNEQKKKFLNNVKKIESPLARYDKDGTLNCILCETVVRSEAVWNVHINSKNHKQNILNKITKNKKKEEPVGLKEISSSSFKRPGSPILPPPPPVKKLKGILKNSSTSQNVQKIQKSISTTKSLETSDDDDDDEEEDDNEKNVKENLETLNNNEIEEKNDSNGENKSSIQEALPEGFFDDPKLDAKVRNVEYKDPIEEEWEQFQKEIKEETSKAQQIIAEDQEEATTERQIDEIDEQIRHWSRVLDLEKKKETVAASIGEQKIDKNEEDYNENEEEFEEFLDWRSKRSFEYKLKKGLSL